MGKVVYGGNTYGGEPVFVPRPGAAAEDDGYVLAFVHDEGRDWCTELWIMDAATMDTAPLAVVRTPQRVPYGFHGMWFSQEQLEAQTGGVVAAVNAEGKE